MSKAKETKLTTAEFSVPFTRCEDQAFPNLYHELVPKTQTEGGMIRIGVAANHACFYIWQDKVMHIIPMEKLLNHLTPALIAAVKKHQKLSPSKKPAHVAESKP